MDQKVIARGFAQGVGGDLGRRTGVAIDAGLADQAEERIVKGGERAECDLPVGDVQRPGVGRRPDQGAVDVKRQVRPFLDQGDVVRIAVGNVHRVGGAADEGVDALDIA